MTEDDARQALVTIFDAAFKAAWPAVPVEYDNRATVDRDAQLQVGPFVEFAVDIYESEAANVGFPVLERTLGAVFVVVNAPSGSGTSQTLQILETVKRTLSYKQQGTLHTFGTSRSKVADLPGYRSEALLVSFYYDTQH